MPGFESVRVAPGVLLAAPAAVVLVAGLCYGFVRTTDALADGFGRPAVALATDRDSEDHDQLDANT